MPVFSGAALRFSLAAFVFVLIAPTLAKREGGSAPGWRLSMAMGFLNFAISYGVVYWGEQVLPSGLASVVDRIMPNSRSSCGFPSTTHDALNIL